MAKNKIPTTMNLTERQTLAIQKEASGKDLSFAEVMRRIIDEWMDRKPKDGLGAKLYQEPR